MSTGTQRRGGKRKSGSGVYKPGSGRPARYARYKNEGRREKNRDRRVNRIARGFRKVER